MQFEDFSKQLENLYSPSEIKSLFHFLKKEENISWQNAVDRLAAFEPLDYIIGHTPFYQNNFFVSKDTLIPRPETEEMVEWIVAEQKKSSSIHILDIGTGSGCIAISLALNIKNSQVTAIDVSKEAIQIAEKNALNLGAKIHFLNIDFLNNDNWDSLEKFDLIVSNPPYIPENERESMSKNVLKYEPEISLFVSDSNPLVFYNKIFEFAQNHLKPNGVIYCETSQNIQLLEFNGFQIESKLDLSGNPRFIKGIKK